MNGNLEDFFAIELSLFYQDLKSEVALEVPDIRFVPRLSLLVLSLDQKDASFPIPVLANQVDDALCFLAITDGIDEIVVLIV